MESEPHQLFALLGHPQRLAVLRLLIRRHPDRVPAGEIAAALGLKASTLSEYLAALTQGGLIAPERAGTSLRYGIAPARLRRLADILLFDTLRARGDLVPPLPATLRFGAPAMPAAEPGRKFNVLFICSGNSARSIFAEAILAKLGGDRFNAYSAGMNPAATLNPFAVEMLKDKGYDISGLHAKHISEFQQPGAPVMDFVFTVCDRAANEDCASWPGQPITGHWGVPDPVKATGTEAEKRLAFQHAYGQLRNRIAAFANLPVERLDRVALQARVDELGRAAAASEA